MDELDKDALIAELLAALETLVEYGTDSPEHRAAEATIAKACGWAGYLTYKKAIQSGGKP